MKKNSIVLAFLLFCMIVVAQPSGTQRMSFTFKYFADTTIVRNYNDTLSVYMSYGHDSNTIAINGLANSSSFILRDNTNSNLTHLVTLPIGYRVNDVRFVSLKQISGDVDWYCCFCGTRYKYRDIYAMIDSNGNPTNTYYYVYDSIGFVGFFSMKEALSPNSTYSAKMRDVEKASQLFRMTCYAEYRGEYFNSQSTYEENAVLDVIGVPTLETGMPSAFWRVKFYPVYPTSLQPSGTRWDNNIRYDTLRMEKMLDITQTDSNVVTVSKKISSDNVLWLRFSKKEIVLTLGGLGLNTTIHPLMLNTLEIGGWEVPGFEYAVVETPKLCDVYDDEMAVAFRMENPEAGKEGLLTFRHNLLDGNGFLEGLFDEGSYGLDDIVYLPEYDATATLQRQYRSRSHITDINYWSPAIGIYHLKHRLLENSINLQSLYKYDLGGDHLLWSGIDAVTRFPPYVLYQRVPDNDNLFESCQKQETMLSIHSKIYMGIGYHKFPIIRRFDDEWEKYPVTFQPFNPYNINKNKLCEIKK